VDSAAKHSGERSKKEIRKRRIAMMLFISEPRLSLPEFNFNNVLM
jgi:hypothetical protein